MRRYSGGPLVFFYSGASLALSCLQSGQPLAFSVLRAARRWHVLSGERPTALAIQLFWERSAAGGLFLAVVRWHWKQIIGNFGHLETGKCGHLEVEYLGHLEIRNFGHLLFFV